MFIRKGQKLGSIQVDPDSADPLKRRKAEKKAESAQAPAKKVSADKSDETPKSKSEPEEPAKKAAPAKKATGGFKSALDKKG